MADDSLRGDRRKQVAVELAERFERGETVHDLAASVNRWPITVRRMLEEAGVRTDDEDGPMIGMPDEFIAAALAKRRRAGASIRTLCRETGIPLLHVRHLVDGVQRLLLREQSEIDLRARYEAGATIRELADETGMSPMTVYGALEYEGVRFRPRGAAAGAADSQTATCRQALAAELRAAYDKGAPIEQVAAQYERSFSWTYRLLQEAGTVMRPRGRRQTTTP